MEGIKTPDGKPVEVDLDAPEKIEQDFARAMSEPPGDDKAPPKRAARDSKPSGDGDKARVRRSPGRPPKAATESSKATSAGLSHDARKQGVAGLVQLSAGACLLVEKGTGKKEFQADAITLASNADELSEAIAATADSDERFARVIDKICAAGPYSALIAVTFSVGSQIARNHGAPVPGTIDPEELIAMAEQPAAA